MFNTFNGLPLYFRHVIQWKHYGMKNRMSIFNARSRFFLNQRQISYRFITSFFALNVLFLTP